MSHTLLIWEMIPEETQLFLIPNEEVEKDDRLELMRMAHNKFINNSDWNRGLQFLKLFSQKITLMMTTSVMMAV
jgi:hypothetical protein